MRQTVEAGAVSAEDCGLMLLRKRRDVVGHDAHGAWVIGCDGADGPVGADYDALRAEGFEYHVEVGMEVLRAPARPARLGDHSGDLAPDVGKLREGADVGVPRLEGGLRDERLGDVVGTKRCPGNWLTSLTAARSWRG